MTIYAYSEETRKISFTYDHPYPQGFEELLSQHGVKWIEADEVTSIHEYYVNEEGSLTRFGIFASGASKTSILDDGEDSADWTDLPSSTEIYVDGVLAHTGSEFSLCSTEQGTYQVELRAPNYLSQFTTIKVG